jgi:hypothetical protein
MKLLRKEVLEFITTISNKELKKNPDLRRKLKDLNRYLKNSYAAENKEVLKYLNADVLTAN